MDPYIVVLTGLGAIVLLTAWLPMVLRELPLTLPMFCVAIGAAVFAIPNGLGVAPHPQDYLGATERLTEIVVIVALMGAGLKLDKALRTHGWLAWRLLVVAMPLSIAALAASAWLLLPVSAAAAVLLAASIAPTDPVLASDVQVAAPGQGEEDEVRYTLTAEAGLNDGLAFPFVNLALALALAAQTGEPWLGHWLSVDVVWKIAMAGATGWLLGRALGWLTFRLPNRAKLSRTGDGFVALGVMAISYGLAEMAHSYGFLAVFISAVAFRAVERNHRYHEKLHDFVEQLERLLMMILLVLFGGALTSGGLLSGVTWTVAAFALLAIFVIRPAAGWLSLAGCKLDAPERGVIAFFGIRGLGTPYYLAYALGRGTFDQPELLWSCAALVILISVVLHGVTVTPLMRTLDKRRGRRRA
ncbi:MAG: cation transporter [Hyphomicrobiales bacterium]|nr:cation transporter [Hyphomicrobiales bacterium]